MEDLKEQLQEILTLLQDSTVICSSIYAKLLGNTKPGEPDFAKRLEIISRLNQVVSFFYFLRNDFKEENSTSLSQESV